MSGEHREQASQASGSNHGRSIAEWITLGASVVILLTIVAVLSWLSSSGAEKPPLIVVEPNLEKVRADGSGYYLPVIIRNTGDTTVADAIVQAELDTGSGQPETSEITVDFLDGGEIADGTFVFREDPASGELTTGVTSYKEP